MGRYFNIGGPCNPAKHYMLPAMARLPQVVSLIGKEQYFVVHAQRQCGKSTAFRTLADDISAKGRHLIQRGLLILLGSVSAFSSWAAGFGNDLYAMNQHAVTPSVGSRNSETKRADAITFAFNGVALDAAATFETNVTRGVAVEWSIMADALSKVRVKVSGLPAGLKLVRDKVTGARSVKGVPAAASKKDRKGDVRPSDVKFKVVTAGGNAEIFRVKIRVDPLPDWAYGDFRGVVTEGNAVGAARMTVAASGKLSGKYSLGGTNWTFAASGYAEFADDALETNRLFAVETMARRGRVSRELRLEVTPGWMTNMVTYRLPDAWIMSEGAEAHSDSHLQVWPYNPPLIPVTQEVSRVCCSRADGCDSAGAELLLHRNVWKSSFGRPLIFYKGLVADADRYPDVRVKVSASGYVSFAGRLPNGDKVSSRTTAYLKPGSETPHAMLIVPTSKKSSGWLDEIVCPYGMPFAVPIFRWKAEEL